MKTSIMTAFTILIAAVSATFVRAQQPAPPTDFITLDDATQIAVAKVPVNEGIISANEKSRNGLQVYEIRIETPGPGYHEVRVDAMTGQVVTDRYKDDPIGRLFNTFRKVGDKRAYQVEMAVDRADGTQLNTQSPKVSNKYARAIALDHVPGGTITDVDLRAENGILVWKVDIDSPDKGRQQLTIDASFGKVLRQTSTN